MDDAQQSPVPGSPTGIGSNSFESRSVPCNGQLLKYHREALGWTQIDLAARSGFSRRLIVKAEAGEKIDWHTLETLAEALCEGGAAVSAADLSSDPIALTRRFLKNYAGHQADCVQHCLDFISPEIVAVVDGDPATNPIAGTYRGIREFDGLWRTFFSIFVRDGGSLGDNPQIRCYGNEVLAWGNEYIRVPEAAPQGAGHVMLKMHFEDGWMTYFEDHYETYGMMRHLEQWAREFPDAAWTEILNSEALRTGEYLRPMGDPTPRTPTN